MTRIKRKSQQAINKLNKILCLTHELLNLQEEISLLENEKDFSKAVFIDAKGPWPVGDKKARNRALFGPVEGIFDPSKPVPVDAQTGRRRTETVAERNRALFGPLAHTVKKLKRSNHEA